MTPLPDQKPAPKSASPDDASWSLRALRIVWERRRQAARAIHAFGYTLGWLYDKFPLPRRVKAITTEMTFHAIEHFIVQSEGYQNWLHRHSGFTRLHGLFGREPDVADQPLDVPTDAMWQALIDRRRSHQSAPGTLKDIVVIVPVYKGYDETLACLYSVLTAATHISFTLVVINDASPDAALAERLRHLQQYGLFDLITHERNQGFVKTVNEGMQRHETQDVLLLNADTQVYDYWIDRLVAALRRDDHIASVTPFSNNAELCSYPKPFYGRPRALGISYAQLDQLAAESNAGLSVELPTAVGFCMLLRRAAIEQIGYFDDDTFGRGYGEENDWCLRSTGAGWRHVLAADVFVRHAGAVSFAANKRRELRRSLVRLNQRYPHYRELVRRFRDEDPIRVVRQRLDLARLLSIRRNAAFLMISHNAGGGTEKHVQDLTLRLAEEGVTAYRLSPDPEHASQLRLWHEQIEDCPNLVFNLDYEFDMLVECLNQLGIDHLHIHHLLGFPQRMTAFLERLAAAMPASYDITIHDYYLACPSINLIYDAGHYEGDPTLAESEQWAMHHPTAAGRTPVWYWRQRHHRLLRQARCVFAPCTDTAERMQFFFPDIDVQVRTHPETGMATPNLYLPHASDTPVSIAVIGRLSVHKGSGLILQMAQDAKQRGLPIHFHIFGPVDRPNPLRRTGMVTLHGEYQEHQIYDWLKAARCHAALFAAIWPETYNYTLSIALNARIFPVCFDLGAPAERIRASRWGMILPREAMRDARLVNDELLGLRTVAPPAGLQDFNVPDHASLLQHYYGFQL